MITKVFATDFKGRSFEQGLGRLTLILGPNGSGKSARSQALQLGVLGFIPGGAKTNPEILDAFGSSDRLIVGFATENGYSFERGYGRGASGTVSQAYRVSGSRASKEFFNQALGTAGKPRAIDISAFLALSDQKKLDAIFDLFPPAGDPLKIQIEIDKAREQVNQLAGKVRETDGAIARLAAARAEIVLPAGSLAEIGATILDHKMAIQKAREQLSVIEAEEIRAKAEAETRAKIEAEQKAAAAADPQPALPLSPAAQELNAKIANMEASLAAFNRTRVAEEFKAPAPPIVSPVVQEAGPGATCTVTLAASAEVVADLQTVVGVMERSGCQACAARLVLKKLIRKYGG